MAKKLNFSSTINILSGAGKLETLRRAASAEASVEAESERERRRYLMRDAYERKPDTQDYRNGSYERDIVTRLG